jgi:hypothetical protein
VRRRTVVLGAAGIGALGATAGALALGDVMTRPAMRKAGEPPAGLDAGTVRIPIAAGAFVAGWFAPGLPGRGAVLLLHGVRGSRHAMTSRALFLHRMGIATLAIDLPAHGESPAPRITFGANESHGAAAALAWLAQRCAGEHVGAIRCRTRRPQVVVDRAGRGPCGPARLRACGLRAASGWLHAGRAASRLSTHLLHASEAAVNRHAPNDGKRPRAVKPGAVPGGSRGACGQGLVDRVKALTLLPTGTTSRPSPAPMPFHDTTLPRKLELGAPPSAITANCAPVLASST